MHDLCALFFDGKVKESADLQIELMDFVHALFVEVNPIPVKTGLSMMGFDMGPLRLPLTPASDATCALLKEAMAAHGLL